MAHRSAIGPKDLQEMEAGRGVQQHQPGSGTLGRNLLSQGNLHQDPVLLSGVETCTCPQSRSRWTGWSASIASRCRRRWGSGTVVITSWTSRTRLAGMPSSCGSMDTVLGRTLCVPPRSRHYGCLMSWRMRSTSGWCRERTEAPAEVFPAADQDIAEGCRLHSLLLELHDDASDVPDVAHQFGPAAPDAP